MPETTDFPESLPESDRPRWDRMTLLQRKRARARLDAITAWQAGDIGLQAALEAADLSRTRFYTVAAEFRTSPTLASLGAFRGAGAARQRLDPDAVNALQAVVADVVAMNAGASVSQLVRLMVEAAGVTRDLPGATRLRGIVETEIRRIEARGQAGHALKMDISAINLPREDGRPHVMSTLIDEGTRLILGVSVGETHDEAHGYAAAARDAATRIPALGKLRWADRLERIEATVGVDRDRAAALRARLLDGGVRAHVSLAPARYGRYFRRVVGERMGRVGITPLRTVEGRAVPDNGDMTAWSDEAATAAVMLAVREHNDTILAGLDMSTGRRAMPDHLSLALEILAVHPGSPAVR